MSKYLDSVINEMSDYSSMAGAGAAGEGDSCMGMKSAGSVGVVGRRNNHNIKAYKMNDLLRNRNNAEEEESFEDPEMGSDMDADMGDDMGDDMDMSSDDGGSTEEIKQFFTDNPSPSDEDISQYAEEHQMDMSQMRSSVYDLIQDLLGSGDEQSMDDEMGGDSEMGDSEMGDDEVEFSARM